MPKRRLLLAAMIWIIILVFLGLWIYETLRLAGISP